jgi:hypothetical protein
MGTQFLNLSITLVADSLTNECINGGEAAVLSGHQQGVLKAGGAYACPDGELDRGKELTADVFSREVFVGALGLRDRAEHESAQAAGPSDGCEATGDAAVLAPEVAVSGVAGLVVIGED